MTDIVKRLREKESRYNRDLLDEAADTIERLTKLIDAECDSCACGLIEQRDKARAEAIKEFAERVKAVGARSIEVGHFDSKTNEYITLRTDLFDQIAKEMGVEL